MTISSFIIIIIKRSLKDSRTDKIYSSKRNKHFIIYSAHKSIYCQYIIWKHSSIDHGIFMIVNKSKHLFDVTLYERTLRKRRDLEEVSYPTKCIQGLSFFFLLLISAKMFQFRNEESISTSISMCKENSSSFCDKTF